MFHPTALPLFKALGLIVTFGGVLYGAHAWLNSGPEIAAPDASSVTDLSNSMILNEHAGTLRSGSLNAQAVAQSYASDRQAADARFKGQRMQIQGVVNGVESGQGQVLLITFGADNGDAGLRAVVDGASQPLVGQAVVGQPLALDCLNQGLLLAEPVLSDCRVLP